MKSGEAVRIMTGAPLPSGADSVQQVELTRDLSPELVEIQQPVSLGRSIVTRAARLSAERLFFEPENKLTLRCWRPWLLLVMQM